MPTLASLRRPEYTGERRCWPCTVLNLGILSVAVATVGFFRPLPAAVLGVVGLAWIWLRGYVVPFTPRIGPHVAAWLPGDFGHTTTSDTLGDLDPKDADGEVVLEALVGAGVIEISGDALGVDEAFASEWQRRMDDLVNSSEDEVLDAATAALDGVESARLETPGDERYLVVSGPGTTAWLRWPVAIAEVAAAETLAGTELPAANRALAAHALCAFLETCPVCGAEVVEGPADDCCGNTVPAPGHDPPQVLACDQCNVAFYTLEPSDGTGGTPGA